MRVSNRLDPAPKFDPTWMQVLRLFGYVFPMHSEGWSVTTAKEGVKVFVLKVFVIRIAPQPTGFVRQSNRLP